MNKCFQSTLDNLNAIALQKLFVLEFPLFSQSSNNELSPSNDHLSNSQKIQKLNPQTADFKYPSQMIDLLPPEKTNSAQSSPAPSPTLHPSASPEINNNPQNKDPGAISPKDIQSKTQSTLVLRDSIDFNWGSQQLPDNKLTNLYYLCSQSEKKDYSVSDVCYFQYNSSVTILFFFFY